MTTIRLADETTFEIVPGKHFVKVRRVQDTKCWKVWEWSVRRSREDYGVYTVRSSAEVVAHAIAILRSASSELA